MINASNLKLRLLVGGHGGRNDRTFEHEGFHSSHSGLAWFGSRARIANPMHKDQYML